VALQQCARREFRARAMQVCVCVCRRVRWVRAAVRHRSGGCLCANNVGLGRSFSFSAVRCPPTQPFVRLVGSAGVGVVVVW
jgi:hypothetical protein